MQTFVGFFENLIDLRFGELVFADTADGANPIFRKFVKRFTFFAGVVFILCLFIA